MFSTVHAILRRQISFGDGARSTNVSKDENLRKPKMSTIIIVVASYRQYPIIGESIFPPMQHHSLFRNSTTPLLILQQLKLNINLYDTESELPACITALPQCFYKTFPLH